MSEEINHTKSDDGPTEPEMVSEAPRPVAPLKPTKRDYGRYWKRYFSKPKNQISVLTLFAVSIYTAITAMMWWTGNRQLTATLNANTIARESFVSVQRAFVVVNGLTITRVDGDIWEIKPIIKNSGNTPTRNMVYTGVFVQFGGGRGTRINDVELPPDVPADPAGAFYSIGWSNDYRSLAVIGPQSELPFTPGRQAISQKMIDRLKLLNYPLMIVSGAILYEDVFPESRRHITKYCFTADTNGIQGTCGYWNCADDECKRDAEAYNKAVDIAYKKAGKPTDTNQYAKVDFP